MTASNTVATEAHRIIDEKTTDGWEPIEAGTMWGLFAEAGGPEPFALFRSEEAAEKLLADQALLPEDDRLPPIYTVAECRLVNGIVWNSVRPTPEATPKLEEVCGLSPADARRRDELAKASHALVRRNKEVAQLRDRVKYMIDRRAARGDAPDAYDGRELLDDASSLLHTTFAPDAGSLQPGALREHFQQCRALAERIDKLLAETRPKVLAPAAPASAEVSQ